MGAALSSRFAAAYKELQVEQASGAVQLVELQQQQQIEPLNRPSSCPLSTRSFVSRHRLIFIRVLVRVAVVAVIIGLSKVFNYRKAVDEYVTSVVALGHVLSYATFGGAAAGIAALCIAAQSGHLPVMEFLVLRGADIHANNKQALRLATLNKNLPVVEFLKARAQQ